MLEFNATFFVAMFSFIIFMIMMNAILYKPITRIEEERENLISKNYKDACVAVRECGYATSLDYSKNLISLIEMYGLDQWDPKDV